MPGTGNGQKQDLWKWFSALPWYGQIMVLALFGGTSAGGLAGATDMYDRVFHGVARDSLLIRTARSQLRDSTQRAENRTVFLGMLARDSLQLKLMQENSVTLVYATCLLEDLAGVQRERRICAQAERRAVQLRRGNPTLSGDDNADSTSSNGPAGRRGGSGSTRPDTTDARRQ